MGQREDVLLGRQDPAKGVQPEAVSMEVLKGSRCLAFSWVQRESRKSLQKERDRMELCVPLLGEAMDNSTGWLFMDQETAAISQVVSLGSPQQAA